MTFAEKLKSERARLGLNQTQAATLLGVSFEAVSKWERGLTIPAEITQEGALERLSAAKTRAARRNAKRPRKSAAK